MLPSSRGLGHRPFTAVTGVRIPLGVPLLRAEQLEPKGSANINLALGVPLLKKKKKQVSLNKCPVLPSSRGLGHRPFTAVTGVRIPLGVPLLRAEQFEPKGSANMNLALEVSLLKKKKKQVSLNKCPVLPSSRGLGHRPFTAVTGVRIPLGVPLLRAEQLEPKGSANLNLALGVPLLKKKKE